MPNFIFPNWPAPANVKAATTTRIGGYSQGSYACFNVANHMQDPDTAALQNRILLKEALQLPADPIWLNQIHSNIVVQADLTSANTEADAGYTKEKNVVCVVNTADCLPLLVCNRAGTCVAAIHAGWRGLAAGVIENTIKALAIPGKELLVWLGPAIGPEVFEVGDEVYQQFVNYDPIASQAFKRNANNRWLANIYLLAKQRLMSYDITQIYGGEYCTYSDPTNFYSYRRDKQTGRMANLIWMI